MNEIEEKILINNLLDVYSKLLTLRQQEVMNLYFRHDSSLAEIADEFDVTRQAIFDTINKSVYQLKQFEEKIGFIEKIDDLKANISLLIFNSNISELHSSLKKIIDKL